MNRHLGIGLEFVHVCIDDTSRVAFVQVRANQRKESAVAFLEACQAWHPRRTRDDGQWFVLPFKDVPGSL